jgi:dihydrofolate synthase/folylpolyglutamate synthase
MALMYFRSQGCELVIWETGLGGRLDATNIVRPVASVITNIQYDHQKYLGESLASIAAEKAGIIKPSTPVITGANEPEALEVIRRKADELDAPLTLVTPDHVHALPLKDLTLPLLGEHQRLNAAVAIATVRVLQKAIPCSEESICAGLSAVNWPGRLQLATLSSGQKVLMDGAHNLSGAETLAAALKCYFPNSRPAFILGILQDKDWTHMCQVLAPLASAVFLVPVHSERTAEPHGLAEVCRRANPTAKILECSSLSDALAKASGYAFVTIAGSLYLVGEALELLHLSPSNAFQERGLNEWSPR